MELVSNETTVVLPNTTEGQEHQTFPDTAGTMNETKGLLPYGNE